MNKFLSIALLFCSLQSFSQTSSRLLEKNEMDSVFNQHVKTRLGISYPVFRTYRYEDKSGVHYLVLTEHAYEKENERTLNDSIKAYQVKVKGQEFISEWTINDFKLAATDDLEGEKSIWFWTKYLSLEDLDKDGLIDPVVVYGSSAVNGVDDGRIKILVYYKGTKYAIRHKNSPLDFGRNTQVDSGFYQLPVSIQEFVKSQMRFMTENSHAIFPAGWEEAMKNKKTKFDER